MGINNQKRWITNKNTLNKNDKSLNQSDQSKKFLEINEIKVNNLIPNLYVNSDRLKNIEPDLSIYRGKKIALGVDSFEDFKIWYEKYFVEIANYLHEKKIADFFVFNLR